MLPLRVENPPDRFPIITITLIIANLAVFCYQLSLGTHENIFIWKYAVVARAFFTLDPVHPASTVFPPLTLLTSLFLHGDFWHLAGNMLFLWVFGGNIEDKLGHTRFIIFYIVCGTMSSIIQVTTSPSSGLPLIGASGAIAGVMGAYFLKFPKTRVVTLIIVIYFIRFVRIPAIVFLGIWFIFQILIGAPSVGATSGGVAYFAHIGGFLSGMVLFKILEKYK